MTIAALKRLAIWIAILLIWEAAFRFIGWRSWIFPAPSHILQAAREMLRPLLLANAVSFVRLACGFATGIALGAILGLAMWRFRTLDDFLGPLFLGLQTLPS